MWIVDTYLGSLWFLHQHTERGLAQPETKETQLGKPRGDGQMDEQESLTVTLRKVPPSV